MGHIKEPEGIDLVVAPMPLKEEDRRRIREAIAYYKKTGKKPPKEESIFVSQRKVHQSTGTKA